MIKKEDVKIGLEFVLPFRVREYEEEVARFRHYQIMGEDCPVLPRYKTDLEIRGGFKTITTPARPIFKVIDSPIGCFIPSIANSCCLFVKVTCDEIKNEVFMLSVKDVMRRGEIFEPKIHECSSTGDAKTFKSITDKMSDTYKRKNHDYGNAFSEMYNELGINYGYGKIREKVNRIKTLKDNEAQVANEPLEDALLDCANYCILTLMEYQKRKEHGTD